MSCKNMFMVESESSNGYRSIVLFSVMGKKGRSRKRETKSGGRVSAFKHFRNSPVALWQIRDLITNLSFNISTLQFVSWGCLYSDCSLLQ